MTESVAGGDPSTASVPDRPTAKPDTASGLTAAPIDVSVVERGSGEVTGASNDNSSGDDDSPASAAAAARKRRRGSRGGRGRSRSGAAATGADADDEDTDNDTDTVELPDPPGEGALGSGVARPPTPARPSAPPRRPQIGDTRPSVAPAPAAPEPAAAIGTERPPRPKRTRNKPTPTTDGANSSSQPAAPAAKQQREPKPTTESGKQAGQPKPARKRVPAKPVQAEIPGQAVEVDEKTLARRRGKERNGKPVGRYLMAVHVTDGVKQIAVLEGRSLIEHYVSRPSDDVSEIHGNIYLGKVQNVLPGMEAAFVDISTPKNAVLYAGDVSAHGEDLDGPKSTRGAKPRIETMLKAKQMIVCQVTKNPIGAKGARLTQEVSLPGRFVVLIPNSKTYGISKRLPDDERKRLRAILDKVKPDHHGVIVRTAAEGVVAEELRADVLRLLHQWDKIEALAKQAKQPALLYREPDMAVRVIREEFNADYRQIVIDDRALYEEVRDYVGAISPALVERVEFYDPIAEGLPLFERQHIHEQVHKALDRKVWLPSGGSLIIEHTEALTVIDVNTGKNVGSTSLEDTVLANNLEAAAEIAHQLRLRDIGGIIVIDFIDMEIRENRTKVVTSFRQALARDKTRTQVFDISELGLVEMTRKRIGEGLLTTYADKCSVCSGRGMIVNSALLS